MAAEFLQLVAALLGGRGSEDSDGTFQGVSKRGEFVGTVQPDGGFQQGEALRSLPEKSANHAEQQLPVAADRLKQIGRRHLRSLGLRPSRNGGGARVEDLTEGRSEPLQAERLADYGIESFADQATAVVFRVIAGYGDHDLSFPAFRGSNRMENVNTAHPGHEFVKENDVVRRAVEFRQSFLAIRDGDDRMPVAFQLVHGQEPNFLLIVGEEDTHEDEPKGGINPSTRLRRPRRTG